MARKPDIRASSRGHAVQEHKGNLFVAFDIGERKVMIGMDKPEAAQLVSAVLNAGTASQSERPAFVEVTADPVEVSGLSLSKEENGYRILVLLCGEVRLPVRIRSALLSEMLAGPGDEIHKG